MAARAQYEELARQISAFGAVKRGMARGLPADCPPASAAVLTLLRQHGELRTSQLAELMAIDMSVMSRHVAHVVDLGWVERHPDPLDGRSRLLCLSERGRRLMDELSEYVVVTLEEHMGDWGDADVAQLTALLRRLRESFGDCRARTHPHQSPRQPHETTTAPTK
ncbi:MarR family winged helix-turn-helix transcriptional regulator [Streptomyces boncukensis]|uniref:Winged helix-turn-helix transcriptional regulator n=1 Tax=Streptomyces boncukensis TaxID=2711219 RepID=A0A6G4WQF7_9ACTN|nr:MarR family winged helix-turn-helix transcriptional regulator [Streptomyces boncukensis]NGO67435.1 winged helix-turn-helix transcriptional regulator [Streptomyces boncukensis]